MRRESNDFHFCIGVSRLEFNLGSSRSICADTEERSGARLADSEKIQANWNRPVPLCFGENFSDWNY